MDNAKVPHFFALSYSSPMYHTGMLKVLTVFSLSSEIDTPFTGKKPLSVLSGACHGHAKWKKNQPSWTHIHTKKKKGNYIDVTNLIAFGESTVSNLQLWSKHSQSYTIVYIVYIFKQKKAWKLSHILQNIESIMAEENSVFVKYWA